MQDHSVTGWKLKNGIKLFGIYPDEPMEGAGRCILENKEELAQTKIK